MKATADSKYLRINGDALRRLRVAKGWRIRDLASRADCTDRTIERLEAGGRTYPSLALPIARALAVDLSEISDDVPKPTESPSAAGIYVEIKFGFNYPRFDMSEELVELFERLEKMLAMSSNVQVQYVKPGSVVVGLLFEPADAEKLVNAFFRGQLADFWVEEVRLIRKVGSHAFPESYIEPKLTPRITSELNYLAQYYPSGGRLARMFVAVSRYLPLVLQAASTENSHLRDLLVRDFASDTVSLEDVIDFVYHHDPQLGDRLKPFFLQILKGCGYQGEADIAQRVNKLDQELSAKGQGLPPDDSSRE